MKPARVLSLLALLVFSCGCSKSSEPTKGPHDAAQEKPGSTEHAHSQRVDLGSMKIGEHDVHAYQVEKIVPGREGDFDLEFAPALPGTVRGWVGVESGQGSMKVKFAKETERRMHGHPEIPSPLPVGAKLWVEIEGEGATAKGSFALKR